jgi:hypothetical protein
MLLFAQASRSNRLQHTWIIVRKTFKGYLGVKLNMLVAYLRYNVLGFFGHVFDNFRGKINAFSADKLSLLMLSTQSLIDFDRILL